ncbi:adenylate/guanylate cyclase domain-containing protein [Arenibaculum pallidiluteum]|uniref:adenylate/guanylate cyclase domain-containing protein n=1 Tax=Arenibaculum pallidiluteum TaxID=2812559 RepID=UPI001A95994A|nr:adenylate/guanylate cyclase domain-containing protein [Arenibaculum pallidiluteum]
MATNGAPNPVDRESASGPRQGAGEARCRLATAGAVAAVAAVSALALPHLVPAIGSVDELAADLVLQRFAPPEPQHQGIVLVTVGEDTVSQLACRSPIDRAFLAELIERLQRARVRAIGLDLLFDQPTSPEHDARLREAMHDAAVPVVATTALDHTPLTPRQRAQLDTFLEGVPLGHANVAKDRVDGTVRWHVPRGPDGTPSFPARIAEAVGARAPDEPFRIAWRRAPAATVPAMPTYPAEAVRLLPDAWLRDRIVLVGTDLVGTDHHRTPLSEAGRDISGVAIQGHVLAQILDGRIAPRLGAGPEAMLVLAFCAAGALLGMAGRALWLQAAGLLGCLAALWGGSAALIAGGGPLIPPLAASLGLLAAQGAMTAHASLRNRAERQMIMGLFAKHVSQPIAEDIWRRRDAFLSGGRPKPQTLTATVLFSDIEGFTGICERLDPEPLIEWLEAYLDAMVRIVAAHDGIVLRFVGDAILAAFGVPVPRTTQAEIEADARRAVDCALAMADELDLLNARWRAQGLPAVGIRIGIHTGPVVAGSLGGLRHLEYSLLGDTANTAARLEALAKTVARPPGSTCRIIVGEPTWRALRDTVSGLPVGEMALKGKERTVRVWQISGTPLQDDTADAATA